MALNKYITEYLTTKGVFEDDEGTNQAQLILSRRQNQKLMQWKRASDNRKTETAKSEVEPSGRA
ncbi:hypothetical protein O5541_03590 [Escherichia coli]|nr:hypothetical protein [Escherichia coli]